MGSLGCVVIVGWDLLAPFVTQTDAASFPAMLRTAHAPTLAPPQASLAAAVKQTVADEYMRNRTRILEVWKLVHEVHKKELESDRFDDS